MSNVTAPTPITEDRVWVDPEDRRSFSIDSSIGPITVERWVHAGKRRSTEISLNDVEGFSVRGFASGSTPLVTADLQRTTEEGRFEVGGWMSPEQAREFAARLVEAADEAEAKVVAA